MSLELTNYLSKVDQKVRDDWMLEVIGHDGNSNNFFYFDLN
jgi:hypothetical protein